MNILIKGAKNISQSSILRWRYAFSKFDCDGCSKKLEVPQCNACHRMVNYFHIFSIPQKYNVDRENIKTMARDLQKQFHPDKVTQPEQIKAKMENYSSYINQAKATLMNDLQRAIYLMRLKGIQIKEDIEVEGGPFMQQLFELQMQIQQSNEAQAEQIKKRLQGILKEVQQDLQQFFISEDLQKCKQFVVKYKYLLTALNNVNQRITTLKQLN